MKGKETGQLVHLPVEPRAELQAGTAQRRCRASRAQTRLCVAPGNPDLAGSQVKTCLQLALEFWRLIPTPLRSGSRPANL
jgi:hypothetical protein